MLSCTVVAELKCKLDVFLERFVGRSGKEAVAPIALIENKTLIEVVAVEIDLSALALNLSHTEVRGKCVDSSAVFAKCELNVVKIRIVGLPKVEAFKLDLVVREVYDSVNTSSCYVKSKSRNKIALKGNFNCESSVFGNFSEESFELEAAVINVGSNADIVDILHTDSFEPYALPDTCHRSVPARKAFRSEALLTARIFSVKSVLAKNCKIVCSVSVSNVVSNVEREGSISALVFAYEFTVDPNLCLVVNCAEVKNNALTFKGSGNGKGTVIPYEIAVAKIVNARKLALIYERNCNFGVERFSVHPISGNTFSGLVKRKIPLTVEAEPVFSYTVGTGIFTARNNFFCVHIGIYLQTKYNSLMLT